MTVINSRAISMFLLVVLVASCRPGSEAPTALATQLTRSSEIPDSPGPSLMATDTSSPPTLNASQASPPGLPDGLEPARKWILDWESGALSVPVASRPLYEDSGDPIRLGVVNEGPLGIVHLAYYLLGFAVVPNEAGDPFMIALAGFEDSSGGRFTFPFHGGPLNGDCEVLRLRLFDGRALDRAVLVDERLVGPNGVIAYSDLISRRALISITYLEPRGLTENECLNIMDTYYQSSSQTTQALVEFLKCATCSTDEIPPMLRRWVNHVPEQFSSELPIFWMYDLLQWDAPVSDT